MENRKLTLIQLRIWSQLVSRSYYSATTEGNHETREPLSHAQGLRYFLCHPPGTVRSVTRKWG